MSTDHRKPVVAFVVLAFIAAALVGIQRADAMNGRFFAAFVGSTGQAHGQSLLAQGDPGRLDGAAGASADRATDNATGGSVTQGRSLTQSRSESEGSRRGVEERSRDRGRVSRDRSARRPALRGSDAASNRWRHRAESPRADRPEKQARGVGRLVADAVGRPSRALRSMRHRGLGQWHRDLRPRGHWRGWQSAGGRRTHRPAR